MSTFDRKLKDFERSLVQVLVNGLASGTGVVLAPGWVLTCLHVLVPKSERDRDCSPMEKIDRGASFSIRFVAVSRRASESRLSEDAEQRTAFESPSQSVVPDPSLQPVSVHTDNLTDGKVDLVLLRWDGTLPEGVKAAVFSYAPDQTGRTFHCRGFPDEGRLTELLAPGKVTGSVEYDDHPHWQLDSKDIRGGLSGAPLYEEESGKVIGLVRATVRPSADWRNLTTAHGIPNECIRNFLRSVPDLASLLDQDQAHAEAESRLDDELKKVLDGDAVFTQQLATSFSLSQHSADLKSLTAKIKSVHIRQLARSFIKLEKDLLSAGDATRARKATNLYYAILSQVINPVLVRATRTEILQSDGEPGVLLIPCPDRAVLELIFAGIDGRTVAFVYRGGEQSLRSRNEILLDDLPEEGIGEKPDEVAEFLRDRLRLDTCQVLSAQSLPDRIRTELDWRREEYNCVFAVIKGCGRGGQGSDARPNTEMVLKRDYVKILLVDATENGNAGDVNAYRDALQPINRNSLLPESSP
jgi:hypothetical protein